jgi:transcriptional regulator with XRE-family HTH domain
MIKLAELFDIGDILRALRLQANIKGADEISEKLGVNKGAMSRIERTSKFETETLE